MKKLIVLLLVLMMVTGLCFAQEEDTETSNNQDAVPAARLPTVEKFDLEISAGYPIHWTNSEHDQEFYWFNPNYSMEDSSVTANTAIGISMIFNIGRKAGFAIDADFYHGAKIAIFANPSSDYISMFGANVLIGPVFYLYNNALLRIPLTVGGHLYYWSDDLWMPNLVGYDPEHPAPVPNTGGFWMNRRDLQVGPGISLGVQFHFNKSIYIFSRTSVIVDIFRWHEIRYIADDGTGEGALGAYTDQTKTETEFSIGWEIKPVIGLGIKF